VGKVQHVNSIGDRAVGAARHLLSPLIRIDFIKVESISPKRLKQKAARVENLDRVSRRRWRIAGHTYTI
jgi:hypothetical protein